MITILSCGDNDWKWNQHDGCKQPMQSEHSSVNVNGTTSDQSFESEKQIQHHKCSIRLVMIRYVQQWDFNFYSNQMNLRCYYIYKKCTLHSGNKCICHHSEIDKIYNYSFDSFQVINKIILMSYKYVNYSWDLIG